jgi:hypothetical protein
LSDDRMLNKAYMSKFGVPLGEVTIIFEKRWTLLKPSAPSLIPLLAWDHTSVVCGMIVGGGASVGTTNLYFL